MKNILNKAIYKNKIICYNLVKIKNQPNQKITIMEENKKIIVNNRAMGYKPSQ